MAEASADLYAAIIAEYKDNEEIGEIEFIDFCAMEEEDLVDFLKLVSCHSPATCRWRLPCTLAAHCAICMFTPCLARFP